MNPFLQSAHTNPAVVENHAPNFSRFRQLKGSVAGGILAGYALNGLGPGSLSLATLKPESLGIEIVSPNRSKRNPVFSKAQNSK